MLIKKLIFTGFIALSTLYPLTNAAAAASCSNDTKLILNQIRNYNSIAVPQGKYRNDKITDLSKFPRYVSTTVCENTGFDYWEDKTVIVRWDLGNWGNTLYILRILGESAICLKYAVVA